MTNDTIRTDDAGEELLLVVHKHWASLVGQVAYTLVPGLAVLGTLFIFRGSPLSTADSVSHAIVSLVTPLCFFVLWTILTLQWTNYYLDMLILTDRRLIYTSQVNFVQRTIEQWSTPDIRNARVRFSNLFQSFFNYGAVLIESNAREPIAIDGIPDPSYIAAVILKQDERYAILKETARKQRELLHFISHEVKGHLAKSKAAFAAILEGDFGAIPAPLHSLADEALADSQKGVDTVMSILNSGDGTRDDIRIETQPFDLSRTVRRAAEEFQPRAAQKGLLLRTDIDPACVVAGDEEKIERHVIRNLIENALRYTPAGSVEVTLHCDGPLARLRVADTGVGISAGDMERLFTEGGHGQRSRSINPDSTGYGLFVAKKIVDAHGGSIWARSPGPGSGSQFFAEFPLADTE